MNKEYNLKKVSELLKNSRQASFTLVQKKRLKCIRRGRVIYVADHDLLDYCKLRIGELDAEKKNLSELINYLQ